MQFTACQGFFFFFLFQLFLCFKEELGIYETNNSFARRKVGGRGRSKLSRGLSSLPGTKTGGRRQRTGGKTEGRCSKIKHQGSRTPERAEGHSSERDALGGEIRASHSPGVWQSGVLDKQTLSQTGQEHLEGPKWQRVPEEEPAWGYP